MQRSRTILHSLLATVLVCSTFSFADEGRSEEQKRTIFRAAYNGQRADKRLAAIAILNDTVEQRSIETLYIVSFRDPDPEVRSRAFTVLVHCPDQYGYTAYLAADSFKREKESGVKVEKAVGLGSLEYKWSALNELTTFLRTLRWNDWEWNSSNANESGYVAAGSPSDLSGSDASGKPSPKNEVGKDGYDPWRNREPLRWRNENELMGLIAGSINRLSGTRIESRPRIDQEVVKWWDRKSDEWAERDRNLRTRRLPKWNSTPPKDMAFKDVKELHDDSIQPGKDTLKELVTRANADAAPAEAPAKRQPREEDE